MAFNHLGGAGACGRLVGYRSGGARNTAGHGLRDIVTSSVLPAEFKSSFIFIVEHLTLAHGDDDIPGSLGASTAAHL
jgi:hypothetical protein